MASDYGFGGGASINAAKKAQMMEQMKGELAMANAQQLIQKMSDKCFIKCVTYPSSGGLDTRQQTCISNCVDRFMESWNIVSKTYNERIQKDRVGMH
jgi:import inner membrane translocase subunit TIM13